MQFLLPASISTAVGDGLSFGMSQWRWWCCRVCYTPHVAHDLHSTSHNHTAGRSPSFPPVIAMGVPRSAIRPVDVHRSSRAWTKTLTKRDVRRTDNSYSHLCHPHRSPWWAHHPNPSGKRQRRQADKYEEISQGVLGPAVGVARREKRVMWWASPQKRGETRWHICGSGGSKYEEVFTFHRLVWCMTHQPDKNHQ
jgi:hypothetical protein